MGDACQRAKNHVAVDRAIGQLSGTDIFTEAQRVNNFDAEQRAFYERTMANHYGLSPKKGGKSAWDVMSARSKKGGKPSIADDRLYARPSEQFSPKFFNAIDKKATAWSKSKNPDIKSYQEQVGKPVRELIKAIDSVVTSSKSKAQMNAKLGKFGLNADTVYDARQYLDWMSKGGHLAAQGDAKPFIKKASQLATAQANLNLTWTMGNGVDMIRVYSHYLTRPGGLKTVIRGTYEALAKTKGVGMFQRIPELDKQGVYQSIYLDRGHSNKWNPFEWSITAQKNLTWHLDKASGGDGHTGIRDLLFDTKPWDRPRYDRFQGSDLVFGLARYPINETRWLFKTTAAAMKGDAREAANLGVFLLARAAVTGLASNIPAPVWMALPKDMKDAIREQEEKYNLNLIKIVSGNTLKAMGMNAEIDLTNYVQPMGGSLGARASQLVTSITDVGKSASKTVINTAQGKLPAAATNAAATAMALANFGALAGTMKKLAPALAPAAEALEKSPWNSTTITKLFKTTATELEKEFNSERYGTNVVKAVFGERNVKKAEPR